jgi:ABC-type transport system involved in cytochrome c biogenesis permease component
VRALVVFFLSLMMLAAMSTLLFGQPYFSYVTPAAVLVALAVVLRRRYCLVA